MFVPNHVAKNYYGFCETWSRLSIITYATFSGFLVSKNYSSGHIKMQKSSFKIQFPYTYRKIGRYLTKNRPQFFCSIFFYSVNNYYMLLIAFKLPASNNFKSKFPNLKFMFKLPTVLKLLGNNIYTLKV